MVAASRKAFTAHDARFHGSRFINMITVISLYIMIKTITIKGSVESTKLKSTQLPQNVLVINEQVVCLFLLRNLGLFFTLDGYL